MDIEQARFNMIEQQIRTWDVLDQKILELLGHVKREYFVPAAYQGIAFADVEIPLTDDQPEGYNEHMLYPKLDARMLQILNLQGHERVLEIGTGSGYFTALLSQMAKKVISIEIHSFLAREARLRLAEYPNIDVLDGDGSKGVDEAGPYDAIVISGSVPVVPSCLFEQLTSPGKLLCIVGKAPSMTLTLYEQTTSGQRIRTDILETTVLPYLKNIEAPLPPLI